MYFIFSITNRCCMFKEEKIVQTLKIIANEPPAKRERRKEFKLSLIDCLLNA